MSTPQEPFEPDHLIRLLHAQYPQRTDVLRALQLCGGGYWKNKDYIYFIRSMLAEQPNRESQIVEKVFLEDQKDGTIVLDVVADGRIAGIGYLSKVAQ
jgi:hypothetical protein